MLAPVSRWFILWEVIETVGNGAQGVMRNPLKTTSYLCRTSSVINANFTTDGEIRFDDRKKYQHPLNYRYGAVKFKDANIAIQRLELQ